MTPPLFARRTARPAAAGPTGPNCVHLDGSNDYLDGASNLAFDSQISTDDFTMCWWMDLDTLTTVQKILGHRLQSGGFNGVEVIWNSARQAIVYIRTSGGLDRLITRPSVDGGTTAKTFEASDFPVFFSFAYDESAQTMKWWLDGSAVDTFISEDDGTLVLPANSQDWNYGANVSNAQTIDGKLGQMAIFDEILTNTEVTNLYASGDAFKDFDDVTTSADMRLYYKFDQDDEDAYVLNPDNHDIVNHGSLGSQNLRLVNGDETSAMFSTI